MILMLFMKSSLLMAHSVWIEPTEKKHRYNVMFGGHAGKVVKYRPEKIKLVQAFDAFGKDLPVTRHDQFESSQLQLQPETALVAIYFNNGVWSKNKLGKSVNKPMDEVPTAIRATKAIKYHKAILEWSDVVFDSLGQEFEVIPLDRSRPQAGKPMAVKVLLQGQPIEGVKLGYGELGEVGKTNARGITEFIPKPGFNKLWAGKRFQVQNESYTELSYEYLLSFYTEDE